MENYFGLLFLFRNSLQSHNNNPARSNIMKSNLFLFGSLLLFFLAFGQISCSKSETTPSLSGDSDSFRVLTPEEIANLPYEPNGASISQERTINCAWADGLGGTMSCEGDHCSPVQYIPTGQVGLGCFKGDQLVSTGLYRN